MSHEKKSVSKDQIWLKSSSMWAKLPIIGIVLAAAGLGGAFAMKAGHEQQFWFSYLTALAVFVAFGLSGLFFVIIQHVTRAGWSIVVRRLAENVMITLPALCLLALPVVFMGSHELYEWTHTDVVASDAMLSAKEPYLNEGFFTQRMLGYFGVWTLLSVLFYSWSTKQDDASGAAVESLSHKMRWLSAPGVLLFAISMTFFAFDALMSLDPHWFSTMFGVYYFAGIAVTSHAMLAVLSVGLRNSGYLKDVVTIQHNHDLGKLMFGFTVFFAYIGFSQYFLIWYANIPEETHWFQYRAHGQWLSLSMLIIFGRFVIPFFLLLRRGWKRNPNYLVWMALWVVAMEFVDMFWLIQPPFAHHAAAAAEKAGAAEVAEYFHNNITLTGADVGFLLGFLGLLGFLWALRSGQFDDLDGAAERILFDDEEEQDDDRGAGQGERRE